MIPLFIQLTFTKHLPLYFINILLESQVKEKPIAYTKWEKCLKKDRMHTLTCITQTLFFNLILCYQSFFPQFWDCLFQNIQFRYPVLFVS
jgi:hypothetical protein